MPISYEELEAIVARSSRGATPAGSPTPGACPKCGYPWSAGEPACAACGLILARFLAHADAAAGAITAPGLAPTLPALPFEGEPGETSATEPPPETRRIDRAGWRALGIGAGTALVLSIFPFVRFIFSYLVVLLHEFSHAACGWLFGYPSVPAFDFSYGGGVTMHGERQWPLVILVLGALGWLGWRFRSHPRARTGIIIAGAVYALFAFTNAHEPLIVFMGHGGELIFAGLFIYRAISGSACRIAMERPVYSFCGFFILFHDIAFALKLINDFEARVEYEEAKGGGHWMDFSRLAEEFFHTELQTVAWVFLLLCLLPVPLAFFLHRKREPVPGEPLS